MRNIFFLILLFMFIGGSVFADEMTGPGTAQESSYEGLPAQKVFYPNGMLSQLIYRRDGRLVHWEIYHPDGTLSHIKKYDNNGQLVKEDFFDGQGNIVKNGAWSWYNGDGKLSRTVTLKDGKIDGDDLRYDARGRVNWRKVYRDGQKISETVFDNNGNVKFHEEFNR